jgi:hypothetical protein
MPFASTSMETFKVRFDAPGHAGGDEHVHVQHFEIRRAVGADARKGAESAVLATGETGGVVRAGDISVFAGLAPDLFAGNSTALRAFLTALAKENRFAAQAWQNRKNFFANRDVTAIVLDVPIHRSVDGFALRSRPGGAGLPMRLATDHPARCRIRSAACPEKLLMGWSARFGALQASDSDGNVTVGKADQVGDGGGAEERAQENSCRRPEGASRRA